MCCAGRVTAPGLTQAVVQRGMKVLCWLASMQPVEEMYGTSLGHRLVKDPEVDRALAKLRRFHEVVRANGGGSVDLGQVAAPDAAAAQVRSSAAAVSGPLVRLLACHLLSQRPPRMGC